MKTCGQCKHYEPYSRLYGIGFCDKDDNAPWTAMVDKKAEKCPGFEPREEK